MEKKKSHFFEIIGAITAIAGVVLSFVQLNSGGVKDVQVETGQQILEKNIDSLVVIMSHIRANTEYLKELKLVENSENYFSEPDIVSEIVSEVVAPMESSESSPTDSIIKGADTLSSGKPKLVKNEIRKMQSSSIGRIGWVYIGYFDGKSKAWNNKTIRGYTNENIQEGAILIIDESVGFNENRPTFPLYEKGLERIFPYSLSAGRTVKVISVDKKVGLRNFTWAKVEVL